MVQTVTADVDDGVEGHFEFSARWGNSWDAVYRSCQRNEHYRVLHRSRLTGGSRNRDSQPVNLSIVGTFEDVFIDHAVYADGPADQFGLGVRRVLEDEMIAVECRELLSPDPTGKLVSLSLVLYIIDLPHGV